MRVHIESDSESDYSMLGIQSVSNFSDDSEYSGVSSISDDSEYSGISSTSDDSEDSAKRIRRGQAQSQRARISQLPGF